MPDRTITAPIFHLHRIAEICLPADAREKYVSECLAASSVVGTVYIMPREAFDSLRRKWRPLMRCPDSSQNSNGEAVPISDCAGCGGGNAVRDIAQARTPQAIDQAILDA